MPVGVYERTEKHKGSNHGMWKGNNVKYGALHDWVSRYAGQPKFCEDCKRTDRKKYEWANISGKYKRDLKDYKRLCTSCHRASDVGKYFHGEYHPSSKLTEKDIIKIRKLCESKKFTYREIGNKYKVDETNIGCINRKLTWKHI